MSTDQVILATAGYDHTIKFWAAHTGVCTRTLQHPDSQVNSLAISEDGSMIAAGGYQHIRMFDLTSGDLNPVVNYVNISKNVMKVGFQVRVYQQVKLKYQILSISGGRKVDVHRGRGLYSQNLGPEDEESIMSENLSGQCSGHLCGAAP